MLKLIWKTLLRIYHLVIGHRTPQIRMELSRDPYFVGGYHKVAVSVKGISFDDLAFTIREGMPGGYISPCRDSEFQDSQPEVMICFGYRPGGYHIDVERKSDSRLLACFDYTLDTFWKDSSKTSPPIVVHGQVMRYVTGSAFGDDSDSIQNYDVGPALGTRRIVVLLVDTESERYPTDQAELANIMKFYRDSFFDGVNDNNILRSVKKYYEEVSYGQFSIEGDLFGVINLPHAWPDYHEYGSYDFTQSCISAAEEKYGNQIDFRQYQTVVLVEKSWYIDDDHHKYAPACAWGGIYTTAKGALNLGIFQLAHMPPHLQGNQYDVASHELGHNLGLGDEYWSDIFQQSIEDRIIGDWELMANHWEFSHFTIANRLMLGWIGTEQIKRYNFHFSGITPINETVDIHPIEKMPAPTGTKSGIEIRIAPGWNYYVEYRAPQPDQIGDQSLPTKNVLLVTDVMRDPNSSSVLRQQILKVPNDADGDGSVLGVGQDFDQTDFSAGTVRPLLRIAPESIEPDVAVVRIQYGNFDVPDPYIRPWPASAERACQSPDIEVVNERTSEPGWENIPWAGHSNRIIAYIRNASLRDAPDVYVDFSVKDFTVSGGQETPLGWDKHNVPGLAGHGESAVEAVPFEVEWVPPLTGHYCIVVRIRHYHDPSDPSVLEVTETNNEAQSNYERFISDSASAATRQISFVNVTNPFSAANWFHVVPSQTNPLYRTYLQHKRVLLRPGETQRIRVMFEFDADAPLLMGKTSTESQKVVEDFLHKSNNVKFMCLAAIPGNEHSDSLTVVGRAEVTVVTGKKTLFESMNIEDGRVYGRVVTLADSRPVPSGKVILIFEVQNEEKIVEEYKKVTLTLDGHFKFDPGKSGLKPHSVQAYYLPAPGYGECISVRIDSSDFK